MPSSVTPGYRNLALVTALFVYLLIVVGGVVRVTDSGLGCPDWPTCYGSLLPPSQSRIEAHPKGPDYIEEIGSPEKATLTARVEYTHRIIAILGGIFLLLTIGGAWLYYRREKWIFIPATAIIGFMIIQVPLGGIVVLTELEPLLVGVHLGFALLVFACTLTIVLYTFYANKTTTLIEVTDRQRKRLMATMVALFAALMFGAGVVGSNTQMTCPDWPLCNTVAGINIVPPDGINPRVWYHLLHRYTIVAFSLMLIWVLVKTLREQGHHPNIKRWSVLLAGFFIMQVAIGALQVWMLKPPAMRALHLAAASAVWMALVILTLLHYLNAKTVTSDE